MIDITILFRPFGFISRHRKAEILSHAEVHGAILGHARIGGTQVAYIELREGEARRHWLMSFSGGVSFAVPFTEGPIVPGHLDASKGDILRRLAELVENPPDRVEGSAFAAIKQIMPSYVLRNAPRKTERLEGSLRSEGWTGEPKVGRVASARMDRWLHRVKVALGKRMAIHDMVGETQKKHRTEPSSSAAVAERILRLTDAEVISVSRHVDIGRQIEWHRLGGMEIVMGPDLLPFALVDPDVGLIGSLRDVQAAVLAKTGATPAAIRRLRSDVAITRATAAGMSALPIDWIPCQDDAAGWAAFDRACRTLCAIDPDASAWTRLAKASKGRWPEFMDRCVRAVVDERAMREGFAGFFEGILIFEAINSKDVVAGFQGFLTEATGADDETTARTAREAVRGDQGLLAILETSRDWHVRFRPSVRKDLAWERALPTWTDAATGIEVVPLENGAELAEEGKAMDHCVKQEHYALKCLRNHVRIVSLRRNVDRLSTAEIETGVPEAIARGNEGIRQHHGRRNGPPPDEAKAALGRYLALREVADARTRLVRLQVVLPPLTDADLESRLELWRPYLVGPFRKATLADLRAGRPR